MKLEKYVVLVYHSHYGCDTGCCGHRFELHHPGAVPDETDPIKRYFEFGHPIGEDVKAWAETAARRIVHEKWPECESSIDWTSLDVSQAKDGGNC